MDYAEERLRLVDWLRKQLIGPATPDPLVDIRPMDRYPTGKLFPVIAGEGLDAVSLSDEEDDDDTTAPLDDNNHDAQPVRRRRYIPPSAVGFSFYAEGEDLRFQVNCAAAHYDRVGERDPSGRFSTLKFQRTELGGEQEALLFTGPDRRDVLHDATGKARGGLDVQWRRCGKGWIITVSLFNRQEISEITTAGGAFADDRDQKTLFEVQLSCFIEAGKVGVYPRVEYALLSEEEQELELQYKHRRIYAVGHGAAVDWHEIDGTVREIYSAFLPAVEVPQVTADVAEGGDEVLSIAFLAATEVGGANVSAELVKFVDGYADWVAAQEKELSLLEDTERSAGTRITTRMNVAVSRMRRGIALLQTDPLASQAFALANQAMLDQMQRTDQINNKSRDLQAYRWRPFQLAFLLTVMESTIRDDDEFRDVVDLIWFPTGGGKTEAYLGLIAFLVVWRRLKFPSTGAGTCTVMRYTLRLLTTQQYHRATRMICALELIRRRTPELGAEPITVGLWVGDATSPNRYDKAKELVEQAATGHSTALMRLVLENCPWCGTPFTAPHSYVATDQSFRFCCTHRECDFGGHERGETPCNVVDEALYEHPPTLLIATVDKLARLAWEERAAAFFGGDRHRPPELVIQDELHLISGALGSIAGIYEAALDTVLVRRGVHPKYVASTATIRMAAQQVERLYGRELAVFPPSGVNCDDSYFARTVPTSQRPGRLYLGYLAPGLDRQHCMAPLAAALFAAPEAVFDRDREDRSELLEAWWTQVVYHGSIKGVGSSHNAFNIDVRDFYQRLADEHKESGQEFQRPTAQIAQLTSRSSAEENAKTFSRLALPHTDADALDALLATNMVSVGLDVSRLALMIINGQPLTTAEYIQASSRVGRSDVPGLVVTNYYRDQARSLSHYENFRPYHDSFYRFVESSSVTPFAYQARQRALHAALVIAVRHSCKSYLRNDGAGRFDPTDDNVRKTIEVLEKRCGMADRERAPETAKHLMHLVERWSAEVELCRADKRSLNYQGLQRDKTSARLLYNHDDRIAGLWATLQSMRNVEKTALLKPL
ncbi:helicase [Halorhodospira abdelmalekii]|uniref:helicase-related protein n=1 Tax=Halorhodospira abdelmalekii TaxID=421629 RepID=UPI001905D4BF|nr:helicase-related protein [Halorhodospira abdelmalekii]MBK1735382.1 helicase [Halorhodospira abdelmalekii]